MMALLGLEARFHYQLPFFLGPSRDDDGEKHGCGVTRSPTDGRTMCCGLGNRGHTSHK